MNKPIKLCAYTEQGQEDLDKSLSTASKYLVEVCSLAAERRRPVVIAYPYKDLPLFTTLAAVLARERQRDVLLVTANKKVRYYMEEFQRLCLPDGQNLFMFTIPLLVSDEGTEIKIVSDRVAHRNKKQVSNYLLSIALNPQMRKIVFCGYDQIMAAFEEEQQTFFSEIKQKKSLNVKVRLVLLEDIDALVRTEADIEILANWINKFGGMNYSFIIHTTNPYGKNTQLLSQKIGAVILDYNHQTLRKLEGKYPRRTHCTYDLVRLKAKAADISMIGNIPVTNLDFICEEVDEILRDIGRSRIKIPDSFASLLSMRATLISCLVHPSNFKFLSSDSEGKYEYVSVDQYLNYLRSQLDLVEEEAAVKLEALIAAIATLYAELKETARLGDTEGYAAQCKNTLLLKYLIDNTTNNSKFVVIPFTKSEVRSLQQNIQQAGIRQDLVEVVHIKRIAGTGFHGKTAILGSVPRSAQYLNDILNNFDDVKVLSYAGWDANNLNRQIEHAKTNQLPEDSKAKFDALKQQLPELEDLHLFENEQQAEETPPDIRDAVEVEPVYFDDTLALSRIEEGQSATETPELQVTVQTLDSDRTVKIDCGLSSEFMVVSDDGTYESKPAEELEPGETVVRFGSGQKDDILKLISEIYRLDDDVDTDILRLWKSMFAEWLVKLRKSLSTNGKPAPYKQVYAKYVELCDTEGVTAKSYVTFVDWIHARRIGPEHAIDVRVLGTLSGFPNIEAEYDYIYNQMKLLRNIHVQIGFKIAGILRAVIQRQQVQDLSFQEQMIYERVRIYKVVSIKHLG